MSHTDSHSSLALKALARSPRRLLLALVGLVSVALGALGVFVPGLPTTIFLIVASYCFTRSCPWLEERLLRTRLFRPYLRFVDDGYTMSTRTRILITVLMWASVLLGLLGLRASGGLEIWLLLLILGAAVVGTYAVARWGQRRGGKQV